MMMFLVFTFDSWEEGGDRYLGACIFRACVRLQRMPPQLVDHPELTSCMQQGQLPRWMLFRTNAEYMPKYIACCLLASCLLHVVSCLLFVASVVFCQLLGFCC